MSQSDYIPYKVKLTEGQLKRLASAFKNKSPITLRLTNGNLTGQHELMLTKTQINKLNKAKKSGVGSDIKISKTQISKITKDGGSLFGSLLSLGTKLLPMATKVASKAAPALASGALSALGSLGIDKIFGKGIEIPKKFFPQLNSLINLFTKKQIENLNKVSQSGGKLYFKPTQRQINGGLLGTLAAIGIPMAIDLASKLFGKGLTTMPKPGKGLMMMPKPGMMMPPPVVGTWEGQGVKKKRPKKEKDYY